MAGLAGSEIETGNKAPGGFKKIQNAKYHFTQCLHCRIFYVVLLIHHFIALGLKSSQSFLFCDQSFIQYTF